MSQSESRRVAHCMYVEIEFKKKERKKERKKKKKEILILKVWFYGNSVKLRQSPTHGFSQGNLAKINAISTLSKLSCSFVPHATQHVAHDRRLMCVYVICT